MHLGKNLVFLFQEFSLMYLLPQITAFFPFLNLYLDGSFLKGS